MAAGIAAISPHFVPVAFGNEWGPMVLLIQLLAIWGGVRAFGANVGPIYKSIGRPDIEVKIQATKVLLGTVGIFPAAEYFGVNGVIILIISLALLTVPVHLFVLAIILETDIITLLKPAFYPFVGSILMYVIVTQLLGFVPISVSGLMSLILIGAFFYSLYIFTIDILVDYGLKSLINSVFKSI